MVEDGVEASGAVQGHPGKLGKGLVEVVDGDSGHDGCTNVDGRRAGGDRSQIRPEARIVEVAVGVEVTHRRVSG